MAMAGLVIVPYLFAMRGADLHGLEPQRTNARAASCPVAPEPLRSIPRNANIKPARRTRAWCGSSRSGTSTSKARPSKLPSGTRTVRVNTSQQACQAGPSNTCVVRIFTVWNLNVQGTGSKLPSGTRTVRVNSSQREYQAGPSNTCVVRIITVWNLNVKGTGSKLPSGTRTVRVNSSQTSVPGRPVAPVRTRQAMACPGEDCRQVLSTNKNETFNVYRFAVA